MTVAAVFNRQAKTPRLHRLQDEVPQSRGVRSGDLIVPIFVFASVEETTVWSLLLMWISRLHTPEILAQVKRTGSKISLRYFAADNPHPSSGAGRSGNGLGRDARSYLEDFARWSVEAPHRKS